MNKQREWLRSQGFKVGERGRLSPEMLTALANYVDDNGPKPISVELVIHEPEYVKMRSPLIREARTLYGITKEGYKVGFTTCRACDQHMSSCSCKDGILAPESVVYTKEKDVYIKSY